MEVPPAREVVPRIQALVEIFREKRLPVVFTEFTYSPRPRCWWGPCTRSTVRPSRGSRPVLGAPRRRASRGIRTPR